MVRAVGVADERMREDRLRALRAIRFAARFDFTIDDATWNAIVASAPYLTRLSPERVRQELEKTVEQVVCPSVAFARWRDSGAFGALIPSLADVSPSALASVDALPLPTLASRPLRKLLRFAALFGGLDGKSAERALRALRFSNHDIATISALVERMTVHGAVLEAQFRSHGVPADAALRALAASLGRLRAAGFSRLLAARLAVTEPPVPAPILRMFHRRLLRVAFRDAIEVADLAVDGDDLRAAGIAAGPTLGRILQALIAEVIVDPSANTRDALLARARAMASVGSA